MPSNITKFSDIKLRDYDKNISCQGPNALFKNTYEISVILDSLKIMFADILAQIFHTY